MADLEFRVGGFPFMAKNYKEDIELNFGMTRSLAMSGGEITSSFLPYMISALRTKRDKEVFNSLAHPVKLRVMKVWYDACNGVGLSTFLNNGEEPNVVY
jgi:hypothetical protein